jgi:hypothetical protein
MTRQQFGDKELAAAKRCIDAYGADVARWPDEARDAYGALAASDALKDERDAAAALDDLLNAATAPSTPRDLQNRVLAGYAPQPPHSRTLASAFADLFGLIKPAPTAVFASLAIAGFVVGGVTQERDSWTPEMEAYAYLEAGGFVDAGDSEGFQWDAD